MARKVLIGALVVSLSLNLGLAGYLVGKSMGSSWHGRHIAAWTGYPMEYSLRHLDRERIKELIPLTQEHREQMHERLRDLRQAQQELYLATTEEPFSAERLEKAHQAFNELFLAAKARHDRMWLHVAGKLTTEERQLIMQQLMPARNRENNRRRETSEESADATATNTNPTSD